MSAHSRMQATGLAGLVLMVACGQAAIDGQHVARPSVHAVLHRFGHGGLRLRGGAQPSALVTRDLYGKAIRLGNPQKTRPSAHVSASPSSLPTHWIWTSSMRAACGPFPDRLSQVCPRATMTSASFAKCQTIRRCGWTEIAIEASLSSCSTWMKTARTPRSRIEFSAIVPSRTTQPTSACTAKDAYVILRSLC